METAEEIFDTVAEPKSKFHKIPKDIVEDMVFEDDSTAPVCGCVVRESGEINACNELLRLRLGYEKYSAQAADFPFFETHKLKARSAYEHHLVQVGANHK